MPAASAASWSHRVRLLLSYLRIPPRIRNGRLRKVFDFGEAVADDYYHVAKDVIQDAKDRPLMASLVAAALAAGYTAYRTNPDERCFRDQLITYVHDMGMVDPVIRHPPAYEHVHHLYDVWNEGRLRRLNLIFLSILWQHDYARQCGHYLSQCQYTQPRLSSFLTGGRILDVGIFGRWRVLDHKLLDYDVNPEEWLDREKEAEETLVHVVAASSAGVLPPAAAADPPAAVAMVTGA